MLTDSAGFFAKPSAPTSRQVTVHITPPNDVYLYPTTHVVEAIDETNGATIDVSLAPRARPGGGGGARARVFVVFVVLLAAILAIRRAYKRRRRVAAIMESMQNNPDIEKAVANRRGSARAPPLASAT